MKISQFCSVCKENLEMEVVPTGGDDDDGVIWLRCPRCQGFLPKISGAGFADAAASETADATAADADGDPDGESVVERDVPSATAGSDLSGEPTPPESATADTATEDKTTTSTVTDEVTLAGPTPDAATSSDHVDLDAAAATVPETVTASAESLPTIESPDALGDLAEAADTEESTAAAEPEEPIAEYQARLSRRDPQEAVPYRPWDSYDEGDLIHHLAWDDCGLVVGIESLPGNRQVVKVFFEKAGIVRLIIQDSDRP